MSALNISGSWSSRSIDHAELATIKQASDRNHVGNLAERVWDAIADWFCGSNRTEAKQCLFDLYSPTSTDQQKLTSFTRLSELTGPAYQDHFTYKKEGVVESWTLKIDGEEDFTLAREEKYCNQKPVEDDLNTANKQDWRKQLVLDCHRATYVVDGQQVSKSATEAIKQFDALTASLKCTPDETHAIATICQQRTFGTIMNVVAYDEDNNLNPDAVVMSPGEDKLVKYDISRNASGQIAISIQNSKDIADSDENRLQGAIDIVKTMPAMYKSTDIRMQATIEADGQIKVGGLQYFAGLAHKDKF